MPFAIHIIKQLICAAGAKKMWYFTIYDFTLLESSLTQQQLFGFSRTKVTFADNIIQYQHGKPTKKPTEKVKKD